MTRENFPVEPAGSGMLWFLGVLTVLLLALIVVFALFARTARSGALAVTEDGLQFPGPLYGRTIPLRQLDLADAGVVAIGKGSPHRPKWRTNGAGMPGFGFGWFRLAGGEKALAILTRGDRALRLPTRDGYVVLATVEEPERLLDALRRAGAV